MEISPCFWYTGSEVIELHTILLAFDIGTSGLKASLVDENLNILRNVTTTYPTHHLPGGGCEQDAADWWMSAVRAMMMLRELVPEYVKQVQAVGVSGHMLGCLPMDRDGQALRPAMIHADTRALKQSNRLRAEFGREYFYNITGNVLSPTTTLCKALWLKEEQPEIYAKTERFLQAKDYLVYRLCGNMDSTDLSDASHGMLMNLETREYDREMFRNVGLDMEKFPQLHTGCEIAGRLTEEAACHLGLRAGIPVSVGGGDGACANIGAGAAEPGTFYLSLGTTAWIAGPMEKPFIDPQSRVFHIYTLDGHGCNVFGTAQCAGRSISWAQELFEITSLRSFDSLAEQVEPGAGGLIYLPYLEGERSPVFDALAQGVFFGMNSMHKREHFTRAVLEGVACGLSQILDTFREREQIDTLRIIGGGAKSRLWKQIIADVCNVKLLEVSTFSDSATSLGAAAAAGGDDHRAAGQGQGIRQHDGAALGCGDGLVVGGGVGQPGGLAAALAVPHLDVAVVHGNGAAAGGHEQPAPQLLAGAVGVQRPDGVAVLLGPAHVFLGGQFHRLVLGVGHGQGQVAGQAAAGQLQGMVAALGIIGDRDIPHVAAGGAAEPDGAQVGLQARLTIQNTGEIQRHHAALGGAVAAQRDGGGH